MSLGSIGLLLDFYRASRGNLRAAWREWTNRLALNAHSAFKPFQSMPDQYRLFKFQSKADFAPWLTSTDAVIDGTSTAEVEFSRNNTMIFRGTVGTDPDGGYDPYGAAIVYCEQFKPALDLEGYDYLVWRMRELPPMEMVADMAADDPRLAFMGRQDTRHDPEWTPYLSEDELRAQKHDRLQYLFTGDRDTASAAAPAPTSSSTHATASSVSSSASLPFEMPPLGRSLSVMSSLLSVPLPLSHATHPFLRPHEPHTSVSAAAAASASGFIGTLSAAASPTAASASPTHTATDATQTSDAAAVAAATATAASTPAPSSPFDPTHPSHHWMFDGREVWLTIETDARAGRGSLQRLAERLTTTSSSRHAQEAFDGVKVHAHPALLPAPAVLQRAFGDGSGSNRGNDAAFMRAPHARSMCFVAADAVKSATSVSDSSSSSSSSTSSSPLSMLASSSSTSADGVSSTAGTVATNVNNSYCMIDERAPLPHDGRAVPGRPFVNVIVPLRPQSREAWPGVSSSPHRSWQRLLDTAAPPRTAAGEAMWPSQRAYMQWSADLDAAHVTRIGLAIPYAQPGAFAIEVESIALVKGTLTEQVWPHRRPL